VGIFDGISSLFNGLSGVLGSILRVLHEVIEPLFGTLSWGFAIILLTVSVRLLLFPLAVKQINSMRAMQKLQPEVKRLQKKYKVDRSMMKTDPEKYQRKKQQQQEAMMGLYKEHNVNPASSCLPLLAQMPIFFALFNLLRSETLVPELSGAPWVGINDLTAQLGQGLGTVGWGAAALALCMGATTFFTQRQMQKSNPTSVMNQQQKTIMYIMPVMLLVFSWNIPAGVLIYWVTTNLWTMGQQWVMFRRVEDETSPQRA
jgi:YidC/Oxa1 family membrane protein insertase